MTAEKNQEIVDEITQLYWEQNLTAHEIAKRIGKSPSWVYKTMRANNIPRRNVGGQTPLPADTITEICLLYTEDGLTTTEIGEKYGCSHQRISQILRREGIETRPVGQRSAKTMRRVTEERAERQRQRDSQRCPQCGYRRSSSPPGAICHSCEKGNRIVKLWAENYTMGEIANDLGISKGHLGNRMVRMRRAGWDLPRRRTRKVTA